MKRIFFPFAALLCLAFMSGAASINGHRYVTLADWADANGLKTFWIDRGVQIAATNKTSRLVLNIDSHDAEINGVHVALSFPVANDRAGVLVAQFDFDKTIRPLLYPARYIEPKKIFTICLDPGHGGKDEGNHVYLHKEKTYTLLLALELRDQLKRAGFNVLLTRYNDTFVELPDRPALANRRGADLFISLHFNYTAEGKDEVAGPETYCITPVGAASSNAQGEGTDHAATVANRVELRSLYLAYKIQKSLVNSLGVPDRSVRRARFAVLRDATMPAILIEGGYMTNPTEGKHIYDANYRRQMAAAIVNGILAYQKATATATPPAMPATNPPAMKSSVPKPAPTTTQPLVLKSPVTNHPPTNPAPAGRATNNMSH